MNKSKALFLTIILVTLFLTVLYAITLFHPGAWKVYGICFGILGVVYFTVITFRWISYDPRYIAGGKR